MMADQQKVLHRFHSVLVREFGSRPPWDLTAPLTVADICYNLVPFQVRGEELGLETTDDYEQALLLYLAGIGGYVRLGSEADRQRIRKTLNLLSLETGLYHDFLAADVHLNQVEVDMQLLEDLREDLPHFENCPSCSEALPQQAGVNFCPFCGDDVQRVLCPSCNRRLRLNWKFCVACGTEIEPESGL